MNRGVQHHQRYDAQEKQLTSNGERTPLLVTEVSPSIVLIDSEECAENAQIKQLQKHIQSAQQETEKAQAEFNDAYEKIAIDEAAAAGQRDQKFKRIRDFEQEKKDQSGLISLMNEEMQIQGRAA